MKAVAYILALCLFALGSPGFLPDWQKHQSRPGAENLMACCADHGQVTDHGREAINPDGHEDGQTTDQDGHEDGQTTDQDGHEDGSETRGEDAGGDDCCSHHGEGHHCPFNCDCDCCLHVTAMACQLQPNVSPSPITFHFAIYRYTYTFDYFNRLFQPPRVG